MPQANVPSTFGVRWQAQRDTALDSLVQEC
jgi:hypothetical protein